MGALASASAVPTSMPSSMAPATSPFGITDIRTLTAEKQPRSANEMVAFIAYYLSELAPEAERSSSVNMDTIRKHFKMAGFPMPRVPKSALANTAAKDISKTLVEANTN